ncbi:translesion DNA synthesis-associated protein ImuA [Azohydromonas aeria]|uniref:translesion DNA synthesis-associated protein ImuA n=1 Tax=Azohydromonas aeria TaxID=2590212 RepID=UPI0012FB5533|nr:translesion DNA synthesis-associated protein ImuA [Azohydromonas aeria]
MPDIPPPRSHASNSALAALPPAVAAGLWRGSELGPAPVAAWATGFEALDGELPGGGWPGGALTELLQPQPAVLEWRLLGPALAALAARGRRVVLVNPPRPPHAPGLLQSGLDPHQLVWVRADSPSQQLWCTEQLLRSAEGVVVAWLPQARPEQLRRLQLGAQGGGGGPGDDAAALPAFVCRPAAARHEPSAAPLRLLAAPGDTPWTLKVRLLKRRGPAHEGEIELTSVPQGLRAVLPARTRRPGAVPARHEAAAALPQPQGVASEPSSSPVLERSDAVGRRLHARAAH